MMKNLPENRRKVDNAHIRRLILAGNVLAYRLEELAPKGEPRANAYERAVRDALDIWEHAIDDLRRHLQACGLHQPYNLATPADWTDGEDGTRATQPAALADTPDLDDPADAPAAPDASALAGLRHLADELDTLAARITPIAAGPWCAVPISPGCATEL